MTLIDSNLIYSKESDDEFKNLEFDLIKFPHPKIPTNKFEENQNYFDNCEEITEDQINAQ